MIKILILSANFWGIYLFWQYRSHTLEINETHKLKREFIEYLEKNLMAAGKRTIREQQEPTCIPGKIRGALEKNDRKR